MAEKQTQSRNEHEFDPERKDVLVPEERRELLDPDRLLAALPLRPYMHIADVGCGPGYFSLPLAKYLYEGKLYAVDVQEEMLEACRERLAPFKFTNTEFILSTENDIPLSPDSLDGALLAFVLHHAEDKPAFLRMIASLLKKSAWVAVLEWRKEEMEEGPPVHVRLELEETWQLMTKAGLRGITQHTLNEKQYMLMGLK